VSLPDNSLIENNPVRACKVLRKSPGSLNLSCAHFQCSRIWPFVDLIEEMLGKRVPLFKTARL
jgi:hypothetical protein